MFHVIKAKLAELARRIRDYRLADDLAFAADNGWTATQAKPGTIIYRDPRFDTRKATVAVVPAAHAERAEGRC